MREQQRREKLPSSFLLQVAMHFAAATYCSTAVGCPHPNENKDTFEKWYERLWGGREGKVLVFCGAFWLCALGNQQCAVRGVVLEVDFGEGTGWMAGRVHPQETGGPSPATLFRPVQGAIARNGATGGVPHRAGSQAGCAGRSVEDQVQSENGRVHACTVSGRLGIWGRKRKWVHGFLLLQGECDAGNGVFLLE